MSPEINLGGKSSITLPRISHVEYYEMCMDDAAQDLTDAILSIDNPRDALNFAVGLADLSESEGTSDYIYSGAYTSSTIRNAIIRGIGPGSVFYDAEDFNAAMEIWNPVLECVRKAKETPCMWDCLKEGRDFEEISEANDGMYYPRNFFEAASKRFRLAVSILEIPA